MRATHPRRLFLLGLGGLVTLVFVVLVGHRLWTRRLATPDTADTVGETQPPAPPRLHGRPASEAALEPAQEAGAVVQEGGSAPRLQITGRVVTSKGNPAAGVSLGIRPEADPLPPAWLEPAEGQSPPETKADANGRFVFEGLAPGRYRVWLYTERAPYGEQVREHVEPGTEEVVFVVPESERLFDVSIKIRIVDPSGSTVPRAQIRIWGGDASLGMTARGGEDTELVLENACAPVRLLVWNALDEHGDPLGFEPVLLEDLRTQAETVVVRMRPGEEVSGQVVWDGEPTSWALQAWTYMGHDGGWSTQWDDAALPALQLHAQTDTEGRFRFRGLPRGAAWIGLVGQGAPGRLEGDGTVVEVPATGVRLVAVPTGTMRIVVRGPDGERLRSAEVRVEQWIEGGVRSVFSAQTSTGQKSQGHPELSFDAAGLDLDGRYRIVAYGSFGGRRGGPSVIDGVAIREEPYVLELAPGPRIAGRIVDPDGAAISGIVVHPRVLPGGDFFPYEWSPAGLKAGYATTDDEGHFVLDVPPGGPYLLALESARWTVLGDPPHADPGDEDVRIVVEPARRITGRVFDAEAAPAAGFRVTGVPASDTPLLWTLERVTADGFFEVPVGSGLWRVSVWNEEDENDLRYALSDPVEAGASDLRLVLVPGGALAGRLLDLSGRPVGGAYAWVLGPHVNRRAQTDQAGGFRVHAVPPGRYRVFIRTPVGGEYTLPAAVTAVGEPTVLDLQLPR